MQIFFSCFAKFLENIFCITDLFIIFALSNYKFMGATKVKEPEQTIEDKIVKHLEDNGQKLNWLADKIGCTVGHLHSVLKGDEMVKRALTEENRTKINEALGTNF